MAEKKQDQRVKITLMLLQNAFLELLHQKPVQAITVKELCERAGVNRGTFYKHYRDVYDLMEQMEAGLLRDLDRLLAEMPVIGTQMSHERSNAFVSAMMRFFESNRDICAVLLGENGDKRFVADIVERARRKSVEEYLAFFPATSRQKADFFYEFIAWGFIGLLQRSLLEADGPSLAQLAAGTEGIIEAAAHFFDAT